jgi:CubicO group peptidase (beta-lactamase class C family)
VESKKVKAAAACFLALSLIVPASHPARAVEEDLAASVRMLMKDNLGEGPVGMVVGIVDEHGSQVISHGKMDNGTDRDVDGDTVFEIGSITKTFTALLLLVMAERGEMDLDDPVGMYLPGSVKLPTRNGKEIRLRDLATQSSGLPFDADNLKPRDPNNRFADYTAEDLYAFLSGYTLPQDPGAKFRYSNVGMGLLGHVMERKAGTDYESLVVDRICRPLRMDSTRITLTPALKARLATGHDRSGSRVANYDFQVMAGAGALRSSTNDLLKYVSAHLGLIPSGLTPLMERTRVIRHRDARLGDEGIFDGKSAMPWIDEGVYQPPGTELLGHGGGTGGYSAFIGFDTKKRRGVVVLLNQRGGKLQSLRLGWRILQGARLTGIDARTMMPVREIVGIGTALDLDQRTRTLRIARILPDSPASQAGLSAGLIVKTIDGSPAAGKSLVECVGLLRGPVGTKVRLELIDEGREGAKTVELTRQRFLIDQ